VGGGATYWIDGYNVLLRLKLGEGRTLEQRRGELIARVGALGKPAWIAFDSRESVHGVALSMPRRVRVSFAKEGRSADELILEKVRTAKDLDGVVVVSDDREVASRCQFMGARTMATAEFGRMLKPAPAPDARPDRKLTPNEVKEWMKWFGENRPPEKE
jgi:predicted RNA-binding protein with PIN domain